MTSLNDTATYTFVAGGVTAALAYLSNRFTTRRAAVADTLVVALRDAQRSRFLLDLGNTDHVRLVTEPVATWAAAVSTACDPESDVTTNLTADRPNTEDRLKKFDEVLSWRVEEREARIRFAIVARSGDVRKFAAFHRAVYLGAVSAGWKKVEALEGDYERAVDELVRTVVSVRVPSILRPINQLARNLPGVRGLLIDDDDIRMLVADYSKRLPLT